MKRILGFMKAYRAESILAPLFKMLEALLELLVPLVVAAIIDKGIGGGDPSAIWSRCLLLLGLAAIGLACSLTAQYFAAKSAVGTATELRRSLFAHILSLGSAEADTVGTSTLITRMTSDVNQVQNGVNLTLRLLLRSPFVVFGAMVMAFTISAEAGLVFVAAIAVLSLIVYCVMAVTRPMYKRVQNGLDDVLGLTRESLGGARVIRAFGQEDERRDRFADKNDALTALQERTGRVSALLNPLTLIVIDLAVIALIDRGAMSVSTGVLTQGQVVALYNYMSQILVELLKLANLMISMSKAMASANRIDELFGVEPQQRFGTLEEGQNDAPAAEFRHVSFAYSATGAEALSDVSFTAKQGEMIGVIGGTGSGKSTLVRLLYRLYDATEGTVLLAGEDVRRYSAQSLRRMVGVTPQKAQLFGGSIRENLAMGRDVSDEQLEDALRISQAQEFVRQKEGGLGFRVEQGGRNLSGGQRQRLTIARALAAPSSVLILDDSASALDTATDAKLRAALRELRQTVFLVSQRASSVMHADRILVLDNGTLVGQGTHEELLRDCPVYREIYDSQFSREASA